MIFCNNLSEVNRTLKKLADTYTENTEFLKKLADQTENFAVQLIDQVTAKEELVMKDLPEYVDRYASILSNMTDDAIIHSQKRSKKSPISTYRSHFTSNCLNLLGTLAWILQYFNNTSPIFKIPRYTQDQNHKDTKRSEVDLRVDK